MLFGNRIRLRALEPTDVPQLVRWKNDPEVIENLLIDTPRSLVDEQRWFENMMKCPKEEHALTIEIMEEDRWVSVGLTRFHSLDWKNRSVKVAISIGEKRFWDHGYGRDVMRLMVHHAFFNLNLNRVCLLVFTTNERAKKAYLAAGFVEEGRLRQEVFKNGRYLDMFVMSVLRNEWQDIES